MKCGDETTTRGVKLMALLSSKLLKYVGAEGLRNPASRRRINAGPILALVPDCLRYQVPNPFLEAEWPVTLLAPSMVK
jgi:hypothetical protein